MNPQTGKQLTLRLDRALTAMAARVKEDRPLGFFSTVFNVRRDDLQEWVDAYNDGSPKLTPERLVAVKAELGLLVEARRASLPTNNRESVNDIGHYIHGAAAPLASGPCTGDPERWLAAESADIRGRVTTFLVWVPPPLATRWLRLNIGNRKPSRAKIYRLGAVVQKDDWLTNGETIKFSSSGRLLDGQSRLQAIVWSGKGAVLEIRFGLPDKAQGTMDCGEPRRGTHVLEMLGEKNALVLSPALRLLFKWETGQLGSGGMSKGRFSLLENQAIKPMLERHADLRASVAWAIEGGAKLRKLLPFSEAAFFHYLFGQASKQKRDAFFKVLLHRNGVSQPVAVLAKRLEDAKDGRMNSGVRIRIVVKAWNAHFNGRNLQDLQLAPRERVAPIAGVKGGAS